MEFKHDAATEEFLAHWGIKGMKWGVRRYQNEDGSLTKAGQRRYARDVREKNDKELRTENQHNNLAINYDARRWVREDLERTKNLANDSSKLTKDTSNLIKSIFKEKQQSRLDLSDMSDDELRKRINRELLERQYNSTFNPPTVNRGKEVALEILDITGNVLTVGGSAAALALGIRKLID